MLTAREIDELCAFVLDRLAQPAGDPARAAQDLIDHLARLRPDAPALCPVLPLAMAAAALEGMLEGPEPRRAAQGAWRMAALIAAEVLALQAEGDASPSVATLQARLAAP